MSKANSALPSQYSLTDRLLLTYQGLSFRHHALKQTSEGKCRGFGGNAAAGSINFFFVRFGYLLFFPSPPRVFSHIHGSARSEEKFLARPLGEGRGLGLDKA